VRRAASRYAEHRPNPNPNLNPNSSPAPSPNSNPSPYSNQVTRSIDVWDSRTQRVVGSGVDKVQRWQHSALSCRDEVWPH